MKRFLTTILTVLLFSPAFAQSANDLFQQALVLERSEGNLPGANSLYEPVVSSGADRALAAKALIRIGENYERQGLHQARNAYQRVLDDYSEQEEATQIAQSRLTLLLAYITENEAQPVSSSVFKKHVMDIPDAMGQVSRDGRFMSFVRWTNFDNGGLGNVGIIDLETGNYELISSDGAWGPVEYSYGDVSIWSPDGQKLMYGWNSNEGFEIRIYDTSTEQTRVLFPPGIFPIPFPVSWSSDGTSVLSINEHDNHVTDAITLVDPESGESRVVEMLPENWHTFGMDLSPDGRHVVYETFSDSRRGPDDLRGINIVSTIRSGSQTLVESGETNYGPLWSVNGKNVFFLNRADQATELRVVGVENGRASGSSRLVFSDFDGDVGSMGVADDGRYFYSQRVTKNFVNEQGVDFSTGEIQNNLRVVSSARYGKQQIGSVSPSGDLLAFLSSGSVIISNLISGATEVFDLPFRVNQNQLQAMSWSRDNNFVLMHAVDRDAPRENHMVFLSVDVRDGTYTKLDEIVGRRFYVGNMADIRGRGYSFDGKKVVFASSKKIVEMDLRTGTARIIFDIGEREIVGMSLSPDGNIAAVTVKPSDDSASSNGSIELITLRDGEVTVLEETEEPLGYSSWVGISWTPDAKHLVFAENRANSGQQLYVRNIATGQRSAIGEPVFEEDQYRAVSVHPDGKGLTFSKRRGQLELWVLDGIEL